MDDLRELYQEVIFDHNRRPRNCHEMAEATCHAEGYNPLCGDRITVFLKLEGDRVADVSFQGSGCAISIASASLMTESIKGKKLDEAQQMFEGFHTVVTGGDVSTDQVGKLSVLCGVRDYPSRVKCATLAWHTLHAALEGDEKSVSTE